MRRRDSEFPDDGRLAIVWLRLSFDSEYDGGPVFVRCWGHKLKTVLDSRRVDIEDVIEWAEVTLFSLTSAEECGHC